MDAGFVAQFGIHLSAGDRRDDLLEAAVAAVRRAHQLDRPTLGLRVAAVHPEQLAREQRGLVAAGARADLKDDALVVERIARELSMPEGTVKSHLFRARRRMLEASEHSGSVRPEELFR